MDRSKLRRALKVLAVLGFGVVALAAFTGCTAEQAAENKAYSGINAIRVERGLPPLTPDAGLISVARARARDMAARSYFSHEPPDGCNYVCLMDAYRVPHAYAGENIAWNTWDWKQTADVAVDMWRKSPPHMVNITNCRYERFGTGVAKGADGKIYYAMIFEGNRAC